jgi:hypothetical protein
MHIQRMTTIAGRAAAYAGAVALVVFGAACGSALDVPNPQAFGDDALNNPIILKNVANGAEGSLHQAFDDYIVYTELLSDEIESTSTWIDWEDVSEGRVRHDWPNQFSFSFTQDQILQARFAAQSATERINNVLAADAATSPLRAQTMLVDALSDLLLGTGYCESPLVADGPRSPDTDVFAQAVTKFTAGLEAAQAITGDADAQRKWTNVAHAGRARANLMAGNYDAAKADAQAVDPGFEYQALYSEAGGYSTTSNPGEQFNQNRNRSGGLRRLYHSRVHVIDSVTTGEAYLRDWSSGQDDHRMAVTRFEGQLGVNNRFAYYGITKYADRTSPIRMLSKIESNLVEAEVAMRAGDYATEANILNVMRARPGVALPPITITTAAQAQDALVNERMAELWVEGSRMQDLYRFNLVTQKLGPSRATKLPLSTTEVLNNSAMKLGEGACPTIS